MTITEQRIEATTPVGSPRIAPPSGAYARLGKRALDLAVVVPVLIAALPLLCTVALALRLRLGPGILLRQQRIGRHGRTFDMLKFRTMHHSRRTGDGSFPGPDRRIDHKRDDDPRHTRLGRLLRTFSVDELPQLLNVLRGDMSLVGPRPELDSVAEVAFRAHVRHRVAPGLTGPFQVSPLRGTGDLTLGLDLDAAYVRDLSFRQDLRWLLATAGALVRGTGS